MNSQDWGSKQGGLEGSPPGPLHIVYRIQFSIYMGLLSVRTSGSLIIVPFLGGSFLPAGSPSSTSVCFLFYFIIFYFVRFCCYLFLIKDRNGVDPNARGGREEVGGVEEGKTLIRIYYMKKRIHFNKREEKLLAQCLLFILTYRNGTGSS